MFILRRFYNADDSVGQSKGRCGQKHNGGQPWDRACKAGKEGFACGCRQPRESDGNAWLAAETCTFTVPTPLFSYVKSGYCSLSNITFFILQFFDMIFHMLEITYLREIHIILSFYFSI